MILKPGDKVLMVHRRLFEGDSERFFLGAVEEYEHGIARVTGFTFVRESMSGRVIRKNDPRTKIVSIASGTLIVYQLPADLAIEKAQFITSESKLTLSDGASFTMNVTEHAHTG